MSKATRRELLTTACKGGLMTLSLPALTELLLGSGTAHGEVLSEKKKEVSFYEKMEGKEIRCLTCPNTCILSHGSTGICRTRTNDQGTHFNHAYSNPCILSVDPIEKLPLNNFYPDEDTVSIAVGGCNLRCLYCQNWEWSQKRPDEIRKNFDLSPGKAVHSVLKKEIKTIGFTYTDFIGFFEYACEIAEVARRAGIKCISATNGYANLPVIRKAAEKMDAITVGLKGFDDKFYEEVCGARLNPVLDAIVEIKSTGKCWMELTTLIIPTYNDDMKVIKKMARWIRKNVGSKVPWHLSRFVPRYKLKDVPRTPVQTLDQARKIGLDAGLEYVYTSNIAPHEGNNTYCPKCGKSVIDRVGFKILNNHMKDGRCKCGFRIAGHFQTSENS